MQWEHPPGILSPSLQDWFCNQISRPMNSHKEHGKPAKAPFFPSLGNSQRKVCRPGEQENISHLCNGLCDAVKCSGRSFREGKAIWEQSKGNFFPFSAQKLCLTLSRPCSENTSINTFLPRLHMNFSQKNHLCSFDESFAFKVIKL